MRIGTPEHRRSPKNKFAKDTTDLASSSVFEMSKQRRSRVRERSHQLISLQGMLFLLLGVLILVTGTFSWHPKRHNHQVTVSNTVEPQVVRQTTNHGRQAQQLQPQQLHPSSNKTIKFELGRNLRDQNLFYAERIWNDLISEASFLMNQNSSLSKIAIEVGSHRGKQCLQAAISKLESYCLEPSPESFAKVRKRVNRAAGIKHRVHLYQAAAGEKTGEFVQFKSKGGTGDSVLPLKVSNSSFVVNVPTLRLDDLVANISGCDGIYLLKIDTQGYEPMVFKGLQSSLERHAIDFIIFEFWPRGMNQFVHENGTTCIGADLLMSLLRIGYKLYPTWMSSHHSLSPKEARKYLRSNPERPYHDIVKYCQWHLDLEEQFPAPNYTIGYWSDIVAVSPKMRLQTPQTNTGQALFPPRR